MIKQLIKRAVFDRVDAFRAAQTLDTLAAIVAHAVDDPGRCEPERAPDLSRLRMTWVIPPFVAGLGGHTTLFRAVSHFAARGHPQRLLIFNPFGTISLPESRRVLDEHYGGVDAELAEWTPEEAARPADVVLATSWHTAYAVGSMRRVARKVYVIQDLEHLFHPAGSEAALAEETHRFGFPAVTAGEWLRREVESRYGVRAGSFDLAYNRSEYTDAGAPRADRVLCYARPTTPRRAFELSVLALRELQRLSPATEIVFFGAERLPALAGLRATNRGILRPAELNELYNGATAGLVLSATNYSLVPLEMMAAGLPVVDLALPNNFAIHGEPAAHISLAVPSPQAIARALHALVSDAGLRERQRAAAHAYAAGLSWEASCARIEEIVLSYVAEPSAASHNAVQR